jgi:hypothetical protein
MNNIKSIAHVFGCVDNYKGGHSKKKLKMAMRPPNIK